MNVDLPWNPSKLEQRIGRIKRFGQLRDRVDMLSLVYEGSRDEVVYDRLSERMKDRFDIFGQLPETLEDEWIDSEERLEAELRKHTDRKRRASAFDVRWGGTATRQGVDAVQAGWRPVGERVPKCWRGRTLRTRCQSDGRQILDELTFHVKNGHCEHDAFFSMFALLYQFLQMGHRPR